MSVSENTTEIWNKKMKLRFYRASHSTLATTHPEHRM